MKEVLPPFPVIYNYYIASPHMELTHTLWV